MLRRNHVSSRSSLGDSNFYQIPLILYFMSPSLCERLLPSLLRAQWDFFP